MVILLPELAYRALVAFCVVWGALVLLLLMLLCAAGLVIIGVLAAAWRALVRLWRNVTLR